MQEEVLMNTAQEKIRALRWAIILSGFLSVLKTAGAFFCSSASLLASALDSLMDIGISSVNYLSVLKASKPPDKDHPYGHEKIESLASYTEGLVILVFAVLILVESIRRAFAGSAFQHPEAALPIVAIAILTSIVITAILQRAERRTDSLILKAEKTHYAMDLLSHFFVVIAVAAVKWTGWAGWDVAGGLAVASYVGFLAAKISLRSAHELVDRSLPQSALDGLDALIKQQDGVLGYHEMRTRKSGAKNFIDFHLVLRPTQSFEAAHETTESLIEKIRARFVNSDVTIHEDPEGGR